MNYEQFEKDLFLQIFSAAGRSENNGYTMIKIEGPTGPHESAAVEAFEADGLIKVVSKCLDGRIAMTITAKGYRLAQALHEAPPPPKNPIGFEL